MKTKPRKRRSMVRIWTALLLLEQYYRFDNQAARGLALLQMMGPMLSIGRHLPKLQTLSALQQRSV